MKIDQYIRSLRNRVKRDYAIAYYDFRVNNRDIMPADERYPIGYMAKQAVRLQIDKLLA